MAGHAPRAPRHAPLVLLLCVLVLVSGCSIAGYPVKVGASGGTAAATDGPSGLRPGVAPADLTVAGDAHTRYDTLAKDAVADLNDFYSAAFPKAFGKDFRPARHLQSYDSRQHGGRACGLTLDGRANASYLPSCGTIVWDRGSLLPELERVGGDLAAPTVLAHETGHLVQQQLGAPQDSVLVLEQQADCYAGAYWRWVADGHSAYFQLGQGRGMRQVLSTVTYIGDPVGLSPDNDQAHGSNFDRTVAFVIGYSAGIERCSHIDRAEVDKRITETGFTVIPKNYGNVPITGDFLSTVSATADEFFAGAVPGYLAPRLRQNPPGCPGQTGTAAATYCPATGTVGYSLGALVKIGTPTAGFDSPNGDMSAAILLISRYGLAALQSAGKPVTGARAGLQSVCYAGAWAAWMRTPRGPSGLSLSPNDLNKAVYEVINSPAAASDADGSTTTLVVDQVQALHTGVIDGLGTCDAYYG